MLAQFQPEVEYFFRHALIQEAAYQSLVKTDRRMLHLAVGQALEKLYPAHLDSADLTPLLARHFAEAGDLGRALRYYLLAGQAAAQVYANTEAIQHYGRAIEIAVRLPNVGADVSDLFLRRGRTLELNAQDTEAIANYEALEAWAVSVGNQAALLAGIIARASVYVKPSVAANQSLGFELSQKALALAREQGDRPAEAKVLWNLLQYYLSTGMNHEALEHGEQALAIAREQGLRELVAYVLTDLLKVLFQVEQPKRGWAVLEEARSIWRELGVHNMLADNLASTSMMHIMTGAYDSALATSDEAQVISHRIGNLWNQSYALYLVDIVHFERGDIGRAIAVAETCMHLAEQAGFSEGIHQTTFDLALIYAYMGALPRAIEIAHLALTRGQTVPAAIPILPQIHGLTALLCVYAGRFAEAQAALDETHLLDDPQALKRHFIITQFIVAQARAELALAQNDPQQALVLAADISLSFRQSGVRVFLTDALYLQGRALRATGRFDEAKSVLGAARAEAEGLGSRRSLWSILGELAAIADKQGDEATAFTLRQRALESIDYIATHAGSDDLRESFLGRPDVHAISQDFRATGGGRIAAGQPLMPTK
jgi:tetratricopeptide (TPR) repeat protein